jgi:hypothetical protein
MKTNVSEVNWTLKFVILFLSVQIFYAEFSMGLVCVHRPLASLILFAIGILYVLPFLYLVSLLF